METKQVRVILRGKGFEKQIPFVTVKWECPVCGGPMGEPKGRNFIENDDPFHCDVWQNECGHIAKYGELEIKTLDGFKRWHNELAAGRSLYDFTYSALRANAAHNEQGATS